MTDIERWEDTTDNGSGVVHRWTEHGNPGTRPQDPIGRLRDWAESAEIAHRVAETLIQTNFVPEYYRPGGGRDQLPGGRVGDATAAILAGLEMGLTPMNALKSFDVINGTAAPRAVTFRAVAQAQGHSIWVEESTATRAVVCGRRKGHTEISKSVWTIDRAQKLGLTGKPNWQKQPQAMLVARATAECARWVASDALLGVPYTSEELFDAAPDDALQIEAESGEKPKPKKRRTAKRAAAAPDLTPPEHVAEAEVEPGQVVESSENVDDLEPPVVSKEQLTKIHTCFTELGILSREDKLEYAISTVGRPLNSSTELTKAEARTLINRLEEDLRAVGGEDLPDPTVDPDPWSKDENGS